MGKLIILEGSDGSGKETQSNLLFERFKEEGKSVMKVSFPDYESDSSALIKMYLNGELGDDPDLINPYAVSTFYAADRFVSYLRKWKEFYDNGGIIVADRYVTSNMIHQAVKFKVELRNPFIEWLMNLEYNIYGLPKPDLVIFLDVPYEVSRNLIKERKNKISQNDKKDIHEKNLGFMKRSYENAVMIAETYGWEKIKCVSGNQILPIEEIHKEVYKKTIKVL